MPLGVAHDDDELLHSIHVNILFIPHYLSSVSSAAPVSNNTLQKFSTVLCLRRHVYMLLLQSFESGNII